MNGANNSYSQYLINNQSWLIIKFEAHDYCHFFNSIKVLSSLLRFNKFSYIHIMNIMRLDMTSANRPSLWHGGKTMWDGVQNW